MDLFLLVITNFRYDFRYDLLCKPSEGTGSQVKKCPKNKAFNEPSEPMKANFFGHVALDENISSATESK